MKSPIILFYVSATNLIEQNKLILNKKNAAYINYIGQSKLKIHTSKYLQDKIRKKREKGFNIYKLMAEEDRRDAENGLNLPEQVERVNEYFNPLFTRTFIKNGRLLKGKKAFRAQQNELDASNASATLSTNNALHVLKVPPQSKSVKFKEKITPLEIIPKSKVNVTLITRIEFSKVFLALSKVLGTKESFFKSMFINDYATAGAPLKTVLEKLNKLLHLVLKYIKQTHIKTTGLEITCTKFQIIWDKTLLTIDFSIGNDADGLFVKSLWELPGVHRVVCTLYLFMHKLRHFLSKPAKLSQFLMLAGLHGTTEEIEKNKTWKQARVSDAQPNNSKLEAILRKWIYDATFNREKLNEIENLLFNQKRTIIEFKGGRTFLIHIRDNF